MNMKRGEGDHGSAQSSADPSLALAAYTELLRTVTRMLGDDDSNATAAIGDDSRAVASAAGRGWAGVRVMDIGALIR